MRSVLAVAHQRRQWRRPDVDADPIPWGPDGPASRAARLPMPSDVAAEDIAKQIRRPTPLSRAEPSRAVSFPAGRLSFRRLRTVNVRDAITGRFCTVTEVKSAFLFDPT